MIDYSDPRYKVTDKLMADYCALDPDGIWDVEKWRQYLIENASDEIIEFLNEDDPDFVDNPIVR